MRAQLEATLDSHDLGAREAAARWLCQLPPAAQGQTAKGGPGNHARLSDHARAEQLCAWQPLRLPLPEACVCRSKLVALLKIGRYPALAHGSRDRLVQIATGGQGSLENLPVWVEPSAASPGAKASPHAH